MADHPARIEPLMKYWLDHREFSSDEEAHIRRCATCRQEIRRFLALEEAFRAEADGQRQQCPPMEIMAAILEGEAPAAIWRRHVLRCPYCQMALLASRAVGLPAWSQPSSSSSCPEWFGALKDYLAAAAEGLPAVPTPAYQAAGAQATLVKWLSEERQVLEVGPCILNFTRRADNWVVETSPWPAEGRIVVHLSKGNLRLAIALDARRQEIPVSLWTSAMVEFQAFPGPPLEGGDT